MKISDPQLNFQDLSKILGLQASNRDLVASFHVDAFPPAVAQLEPCRKRSLQEDLSGCRCRDRDLAATT
jgi:hypothetical protein